ncbi:MAG: galactokinase [bacterium]
MIDPQAVQLEFAERFGGHPVITVRAPGRVNLIGEHTDYSLLPVLPIAIDKSTIVCLSPTTDGVVAVVSRGFERPARIARSAPGHQSEPWHRYIAGALQELGDLAPNGGANIYIDSDLPHSGGLSSSSALSVGLLAGLGAAWGAALEPAELALRAAAAERRVGVETGGMDQQIIALGRAGHALRIDFLPPANRIVPLPEGLSFVVAYCGQEAPKGGAAREAYNERVVGTRIAALMMADMLGFELEGVPLLGNVASIDAAAVMVEELPNEMSARNAANASETNVEHLVSLSAAHFDSSKKVGVKPYARHVLAEAERVDLAERALGEGDLKGFGKLMNESHDSLRNDFKCSTPALDKVAAAMRKAGSFGAKLTGAGFGGFAVAACPPEAVERVIEAAILATGGPAFEVKASDGLAIL